MTQLVINIGTVPNDGEGDPLRTAFQKINNNFTQLFTTGTFTYEAYTFDDSADQVIFETSANSSQISYPNSIIKTSLINCRNCISCLGLKLHIFIL